MTHEALARRIACEGALRLASVQKLCRTFESSQQKQVLSINKPNGVGKTHAELRHSGTDTLPVLSASCSFSGNGVSLPKVESMLGSFGVRSAGCCKSVGSVLLSESNVPCRAKCGVVLVFVLESGAFLGLSNGRAQTL